MHACAYLLEVTTGGNAALAQRPAHIHSGELPRRVSEPHPGRS